MTTSPNLKLYFPNLNGLRFIGAFFVIINHIEQMKVFYDIGDGVVSSFAKNIGKLGVMLFFVLSGFLITYLLLSEEKSFGKIHVKKFYIRRFLRILPVYFLLIFLTFFVLPNVSSLDIPRINNPISDNFTSILLLHVFFLPNLVTAIYGFVPYIAQAWSIGTEEQSYLLWPILLNVFKKYRLYLMIGVVVFHFCIKILLSNQLGLPIPNRGILASFWIHFNINAIAIGSFFTILFINKNASLKYLLNINFFCFIVFTLILLLLLAIKIPYLHYSFYSVLFGIVVLNLSVNKKLNKVLEWKVINYLGKISYGIYMYHFLVLIPVLIFASKMKTDSNIFIYTLILSITIAISSISYHYYESFFLKRKYSFIRSSDI